MGLYLLLAHSHLQSQTQSLPAYSQQHLHDVKKEGLKIQEDLEGSSTYVS